jgi:putative ABC transport system permease protein
MRLLGYHLRLAWRSILRDRWYSLTMIFVLGLASGVSTLAFNVWLENGAVPPRLAPSLHHVEIGRPPPPVRETINRPIPLFNRSRVSYPDYQRLAASGIPARQTASAQARVLVRLPTEARAQPAPARFVSADFFAMFGRELARGQGWSRGEEARGDATVVLGEPFARTLFPDGDPVGQTVMVEGKPHRVTGVTADDTIRIPPWDVAMVGQDQDALYLPFPEMRRLDVRPDLLIMNSLLYRDSLDSFYASPVPFVTFWVDLPTEAQRSAFRSFLAGSFDGTPTFLRDPAQWWDVFRVRKSTHKFFATIGLVVLVIGGFAFGRLFFAKGIARAPQMAIHRALGALRVHVMGKLLLEASLLAGAAALLGLSMASPLTKLFFRMVPESDVPIRIRGLGVVLAFGLTTVVALVISAYPIARLAWRPPMASGARR